MKITEYHPFRSAEAKKQYIEKNNERTKLFWPIESKSKYVKTSFGTTFVRITGPEDALPLILLHGMNGNSLDWVPNVNFLAKNYRTYAIDTINDYGLSICTKGIKDSAEYAKWLDELFTGLGLENNINLVGMSYGGWLTCQYTLYFQNRVNKIVLLAPAATILPLRLQFILRAALMLSSLRYFRKKFFYWVLEDIAKFDEIGFSKMIDYSFLVSQCFKRTYPVTPSVLKDKDLQRIKVPVLCLIGENEKIYSARKAIQRLDRIVPFIQKEIIPNAGHGLNYVQSDSVNRKILEFLKQ